MRERFKESLADIRWNAGLAWDAARHGGRIGMAWTSKAARLVFRNATLTTLTGIASAAAAWFTYQAAEQATAVSVQSADIARDAQAFAERLYHDQLLLSAPSPVIRSGRIFISQMKPATYSSDPPQPVYSIEVNLHNSGGRDAHSTIISLANGWSRYDKEIAVIPRDVDMPVRIEISSTGLSAERSTWYAAIAYVDPMPAGVATLRSPGQDHGAGLVNVCSTVAIVELSATPNAGMTDSTELVLSPGPAVRIGPPDPNVSRWQDPQRDIRDLLDNIQNRLHATGCVESTP